MTKETARTETTCKNCLYCEIKNKKDGHGRCRRSSPVLFSDCSWGQWPMVEFTDWCGEFDPIELQNFYNQGLKGFMP